MARDPFKERNMSLFSHPNIKMGALIYQISIKGSASNFLIITMFSFYFGLTTWKKV